MAIRDRETFKRPSDHAHNKAVRGRGAFEAPSDHAPCPVSAQTYLLQNARSNQKKRKSRIKCAKCLQNFSPCATITLPNGQLAQLVERLLDVERVRGSSPLLSTKTGLKRTLWTFFIPQQGTRTESVKKRRLDLARFLAADRSMAKAEKSLYKFCLSHTRGESLIAHHLKPKVFALGFFIP